MTTDPNIAGWLRVREQIAAMQEQATERLALAQKFSTSPGKNIRPATDEDVSPGQVLWHRAEGAALFGGQRWGWVYVERVTPEGKAIGHDGEVHGSEGRFVQVGDPIDDRQSERVANFMEGMSSRPAIGQLAKMRHLAQNAPEGHEVTVSVSPEFYERLKDEAKALNIVRVDGEILSIFDLHIHADASMSEDGMSFVTKPGPGDAKD